MSVAGRKAVFPEMDLLKSFCGQVESSLFSSAQVLPVLYPDSVKVLQSEDDLLWEPQVAQIESLNASLLDMVKNHAILYCIWIMDPEALKWQAMYVGQRDKGGARTRIKDHLVAKNKNTGSKLYDVRRAVLAGKQIGISYIAVDPASLRLYLEDEFIKKHKATLFWNIRGAGPKNQRLQTATLKDDQIEISGDLQEEQ